MSSSSATITTACSAGCSAPTWPPTCSATPTARWSSSTEAEGGGASGPPEFGGFSDIDATGAAGAYAGFLDDLRHLETVAAWKERSFAALRPRPGAVLLDVGCGTGDDVRALAGLVAPGGRAIGVDVSAEMVAEARRRGGDAVEFVRSDAQRLELPDDAVDGARTERVLQHLDDPSRAVAEMARVVRPGGVVVTAEPDWDTLVIDAGDPESAAAVAVAAGRRIRTRRVGRALRRMALDAGLVDVTVAARVLLVTEAARAATLFDLPGAARRAVEDGLLDEGRAAAWRGDLATAGGADRLLVAMTAFTAAGTVP